MLGDGGINNPWQANITVNATKDKKYAEYIHLLCQKLFDISPRAIQRKTKNALVIRLASTSVVDFLVENGLPRGNKLKQGLRIPEWIFQEPIYKKLCVRGLIDTDGCLYIHKHTGQPYRNIGLSFSSLSPELIAQVASIFDEFGIMPHITKRRRDVCLYKASAVAEYLRVFGTSNERIRAVYRDWEASDSGLFHHLGKVAYRKVS